VGAGGLDVSGKEAPDGTLAPGTAWAGLLDDGERFRNDLQPS